MSNTITSEYLEGILDGRAWLDKYGMDGAQVHLDSLERTARTFSASSPVGQMLRGERDFWRNQIKKQSKQA
jgi:hypothetical protein